MPTQTSRSIETRIGRVTRAVLAFAAATLGGCYERVVDASGPNAGSVNIQPSERSDTWLDRAVFPDKGKEESAFGSSTAERQRAYMRQNRNK
ncbi:MAG TPA: hypothetical protein VF777_01185 [Phycisphaerales bacterium]